jgi:hypothetical protein
MDQLFNILPLYEHQCTQCDKHFAQAKLLKQHQRAHMAKTCECDVPGCAFKTAWPQALNEHHRTQHTGWYHHFIWEVLNSKNSTFLYIQTRSRTNVRRRARCSRAKSVRSGASRNTSSPRNDRTSVSVSY